MNTGAPDLAHGPSQDLTPAPSGQAAIVLLGLAASLALLALNEGWLPWRDPRALCLAYTLALAPPLGAALLLRRARDAHAWLCALAVALVWGALAWHEGGMTLPTTPPARPQPGEWNYAWTGAVALFIALAFAGASRAPRRLAYPALYAVAWDHALALVVALVFTGMGWLLLWLWSGLFKVIGITLFAEVFFDACFAHPATGVLFGLGLTLGRSQAGVIRALLRVCLALGTVLLPLIALVGLSFALALPFTGLEGLWNTRRAAALLITLVLGTVALTNAVFQDGAQGDPPYPRWLRWVVNGALAVLPVFAALALLAFSMRVRQYGWSVDRLFGVLVAGVAMLYAAGYALALVARSGTWLRLAAPVNVVAALALIVGLLASHAPGTDFRVHAARSQLAQALRDPTRADIEYLRWQLGQPGTAALRALEADPALAAHPDVRAAIRLELARTERWGGNAKAALDDLEQRMAVFPRDAAVPSGLWEALRTSLAGHERSVLSQCKPTTCALLGVDLDRDGAQEWALLHDPDLYGESWVFSSAAGAWKKVGELTPYPTRTSKDWSAMRESLTGGTWRTEPSRFDMLSIGGQTLVVAPVLPAD
jgi:hypothetical protein